MKSKLTKLSFALAACLMLAMSSALAFSQTVNVLLIHGRTDPSTTSPVEKFGVWSTDQMNYWGGNKTLTSGHVYYVQWDAWGEHFDSTTASPAGGWMWVNYAVNRFCDSNKNELCYIICHSAGCAAFENYLAKSDYSTNSIVIPYVIAAESAAGGSELAESSAEIIGAAMHLPGITISTLDESITTGFARAEYNHNHMQGVLIRGTGGTSNDEPTEILTSCAYFPEQTTSNPNPGCTECVFSGRYSCDDSFVSLHSTCGHNRVASFMDCNGYLPGTDQTDAAGTYEYHTWWIHDRGFSGPYSPDGKSTWTSSFHTYRVDHSAGKKLGIDEYSDAPASLAP